MLTANSTNVTYQITSSHPIVSVLPLSVTRDGLRYSIDITDSVPRADIKRLQNFLQKCATPGTWLWQHRRLPRAPYHPMRTPSSSKNNTRHLESSQTHKARTLISHEASYGQCKTLTLTLPPKSKKKGKMQGPTCFSINYKLNAIKATWSRL